MSALLADCDVNDDAVVATLQPVERPTCLPTYLPLHDDVTTDDGSANVLGGQASRGGRRGEGGIWRAVLGLFFRTGQWGASEAAVAFT
ncbi:MAG: hypothetical protein JRN66_07035 [Nitrososphaerota archaeon]|nr:hypothetical protein [Nitrososphaerota archaeon]